MALEIIGRIHSILQPQSGSGKNGQWVKQEFVIETQEQFPKKVCLEAWNDKVGILKTLQQGTQVTVSFNPESREFNGKWYTNLRVWKLDISGASPSASAPSSGGQYEPVPFPTEVPPMPDGDLPF